LKGILKMLILGYLCFHLLDREAPRIAALSQQNVAGVLHTLSGLVTSLLIRCLIFLLIVAVLDYAFQRWQYEQSIKMTMTEFKQEMKQYEGDPLIKARIRAIQRERARARMMAQVPEADVIVTNPTEYAVALRYSPERMTAPEVVAKGRSHLARRIRALADEHQVPIVEDPPLARALYAGCEVGDPVPENLYQAVAEILAYIYHAAERLGVRSGRVQAAHGY
jgi:flagellar biosynthetic protein FlhB